MKVSVVVPTLNEEKSLRKMLESVRSQKTAHDIEIIIVDSYSKDKTLEIAEELADKVLFTPPGIIAKARQKGSMAAEGDIIVSTCADSIYEPDWLEELIKPIASGRYIATAGKLLPHEGTHIENIFSEVVMANVARAGMRLKMPFVGGENMAFTRESFRAVKGFRTDLVTGEDTDLMKRLLIKGKVKYCPKAVVRLSTRRFRKWGYGRYLLYHSSNFLRMHLLNKSHTQYEPIR
ncbi:MAG: glycosyltransferase [Candidatus Micrarchaeota archaeon]